MNFYQQLFNVAGKVTLVTGGSRGIGLMIAEGLVRAGAKVYIVSRKADACDEAQQQLAPYGDCVALPADISTLEGCKSLAKELAARESELHILVNNAGLTWSEDFDVFPEKAWDKVADLDVKAPFFLTQQLLPLLRKGASADNRASVVNVTSINALVTSTRRNYSYIAAKAGLGRLSMQLAHDLMDDYINVNVLAPGLFKSKMTAPLFSSEEATKAALDKLPMKRSGTMEDVAGLVIYLSSRAGQYITGTTIACDGGVTSTV